MADDKSKDSSKEVSPAKAYASKPTDAAHAADAAKATTAAQHDTAPDSLPDLAARVSRIERRLAGTMFGGVDPTAPTGPAYIVTYPNWSHMPVGSVVRESQIGGKENAERLVGLGHVTPSKDADEVK